MSKTSESQKKAVSRYNRKYTKQVNLTFNMKSDYDILCYLETKDNKQGYIKELIRQDIKRAGYNPPTAIVATAPKQQIEILRPEYVISDSDSEGPCQD